MRMSIISIESLDVDFSNNLQIFNPLLSINRKSVYALISNSVAV